MRRIVSVISLVVVFLVVSGLYYKSATQMRIVKHKFDGGYEVWEIYNALTTKECNELITVALRKGLETSKIWGEQDGPSNVINMSHRNSKQTWLYDNENSIAAKITDLSYKLTGYTPECQEALQVARYEPGGRFNEHFDACDNNNKEYCDAMNNNAGQRRTTLLIYLNDDFTGGETEFAQLGLKVKPLKGKAVLFWNVDENDVIIQQSKHSGNPVISGEKWIANKWAHSKVYKQ